MNKQTSVFNNALIWFGAGVSIAEIITGTYILPVMLILKLETISNIAIALWIE